MIFGQTNEEFGRARRWFAWRPVWLEDGRGVWCEWVWYKPNHNLYPLSMKCWRYTLSRSEAEDPNRLGPYEVS